MDTDTIIRLTLNRCGARSGDSNLEAEALLELGLIQTRLEEDAELPWFLLDESVTASLTVGEPRIRVPSDFLLEEEEADLFLQKTDGDWTPLIKDEYDRVRNEYQNDSSGQPTHYSLRGHYFYVGPTPDAAYTVRMTCYRKATAFALGAENAWGQYAPDLIIAELGNIIAGDYLSDFKKQESFQGQIVRARTRLDNKDTIREETNMPGQIQG